MPQLAPLGWGLLPFVFFFLLALMFICFWWENDGDLSKKSGVSTCQTSVVWFW